MDLPSLVRDVEPEAAEEIDPSAKLIGFTQGVRRHSPGGLDQWLALPAKREVWA